MTTDPKYDDVHKFGSDVYVLTPEVKRRKLGEKGTKMKFIGHDQNSTGYKLYDPKSKKFHLSRDVMFLDKFKTRKLRNRF